MLRNSEVRKQIWLSVAFAILVACLGLLISLPTALFAGTAVILTSALWLAFTAKRYEKLRTLSGDLDRLLHGARDLDLTSYQEGELAILNNELQKLLTRLSDQADSLQREKEYLSDSLADISHQLRTPLTALHLIFARLQSEENETERRRLVREGIQLLGRIDWLVNSLLKLAKIDAGTATFVSERVEAAQVVRQALEPLAIPMELRGQEIQVSIPENVGFAGDLAWTVEAFSNILKNCMEHMDEGGTLSVSAQENSLYTELVIEDDGAGINPEDLPHLFERFYKGKHASKESVGIGLALSRRIITHQNGTIQAENRKGGGARFTIRFYKGVV